MWESRELSLSNRQDPSYSEEMGNQSRSVELFSPFHVLPHAGWMGHRHGRASFMNYFITLLFYCVCVLTHVCVSACGSQGLALSVFFNFSLPYFLRQRLSLNVSSQGQLQEPSDLCLPNTRFTSHTAVFGFLHGS